LRAIEATNLTKIFNQETRAVDGITFSVEEGEIYGLLGPNGAGKTTTIKMLLALIKPDYGGVRILGIDALKYQTKAKQMIGSVPQEVSADGDLTGYENLLIFAKLYFINDGSERKKRIHDALEYMGLLERADDLVKHYSGGMMRRLEIAQALVNRPRILFLDEPSIGLDPSVRREVWRHIKSLNRDFKITVMMTTHDMNEADELCDRVSIMNAGKIVATGTPEDLKKSIGGDVITIRKAASEKGNAPQQVLQRFRLPEDIGTIVSESEEESLVIPKKKGEEAIPKILAEYQKAGIPVLSISLSRPNLDDVFLKYTKTRIEEAESYRDVRLTRKSFRRHTR
jgi:ABC-2 type transport system ATP-binding protein